MQLSPSLSNVIHIQIKVPLVPWEVFVILVAGVDKLIKFHEFALSYPFFPLMFNDYMFLQFSSSLVLVFPSLYLLPVSPESFSLLILFSTLHSFPGEDSIEHFLRYHLAVNSSLDSSVSDQKGPASEVSA